MGWTGFNIVKRQDLSVRENNIGYLPIINTLVTAMTSIHEILKQSVQIGDILNLSKTVVVSDQAIYTKAVQVVWKHADSQECNLADGSNPY